MPDLSWRSPAAVLFALGAAALVVMATFMTIDAGGHWGFVLPLRSAKLAGMVIVASAIAVATVLFQTITANRILTPSIMGFDALYVLIQTCLVFGMGAAGTSALDPRLVFVGQVVLMILLSNILFRWLFSGATRSLHLMILVGVICGAFFRSLSTFLQRMIAPSDFVVLQDRLFASFNTAHHELLLVSAIAILAMGAGISRLLSRIDVLALGREAAIGLGLNHRQTVTFILMAVSVLVSVSTALVGPVTFLGLLVASLAYRLMPSYKHVHILPAAILVAIISIVGGQIVLERLFGFETALSIVIEFLGGLIFIILLLRGVSR